MLNIIVEFTHECLAIRIDRKLNSTAVIDVLSDLFILRGVPRNKSGASATQRTGKVLNDDRADWREAWSLFPGDVAYVWHGALHAATVAESLDAAGFGVRSQIIWAKDRLVLSRGDYHWQHEPCWYAVRKTGKGHWAGDRKQTTLWQIANRDQDAETVPGTQKPVECMRRPILSNSSPGQAVYEPFMGSGTMLIAAETTGRVCYGIELNPALSASRSSGGRLSRAKRRFWMARALPTLICANRGSARPRKPPDVGVHARAFAPELRNVTRKRRGGLADAKQSPHKDCSTATNGLRIALRASSALRVLRELGFLGLPALQQSRAIKWTT